MSQVLEFSLRTAYLVELGADGGSAVRYFFNDAHAAEYTAVMWPGVALTYRELSPEECSELLVPHRVRVVCP